MPFYPQTLNRYAYCYNNPIMIRDLDGHWGESIGAFFSSIWSGIRSAWRGIQNFGGWAWGGIRSAARSAHNFVKNNIVKPVHDAANWAFGRDRGTGSGGSPGNVMLAANTNGNVVTDAGGGSYTYRIQDCYRPMEGDAGIWQYHRFIWIDKEKQGYGLTTSDDNPHYSSPGRIKIESTNPTDRKWGYHCKDLAVSADQMTRLTQEIKRDYSNPPDYHLKNYNCHNWVSDIFKRSGIQ